MIDYEKIEQEFTRAFEMAINELTDEQLADLSFFCVDLEDSRRK